MQSVCTACRALQRSAGPSARNGIRRYSIATTERRPPRIAIIGAGPAGYYSAYRIMKKLPEAYIDMYESLITPFGLVRFGVAPDHPEVKKSSENLEDVAKWPKFNYIGNVPIGNGAGSLPLTAIAEHYDSILFAYGASKDKTLGLPGEKLTGVHSARAFVGWYNGLPEYAGLNPDLQAGDHAVILGQGNVALDVARMLLAPVDELKKTDITAAAIETLSESRIKKVTIVGRRGPLQAPASIKELRELLVLDGVHFEPPPEHWDKHIGTRRKGLPRQLKRIVELLEKGSSAPTEQAAKIWQMQYLLRPIEFLAANNKSLDGITFERMKYTASMDQAIEEIVDQTKDRPDWERLPAIMNKIRVLGVEGTGENVEMPASIAFRSIGYLSEALEGLAELGIVFDDRLGIIPNDINGRVLSPSAGPGGLAAGHVPGMYCAGWVKRGPTGVIASTLDDAFRTADILISDWKSQVAFNERVPDGSKLGWDGVRPIVEQRNIRRVSWSDWEKIDAEEKRRGEAKGKVREKFTNPMDMLKVLDG